MLMLMWDPFLLKISAVVLPLAYVYEPSENQAKTTIHFIVYHRAKCLQLKLVHQFV